MDNTPLTPAQHLHSRGLDESDFNATIPGVETRDRQIARGISPYEQEELGDL